jgi:DNA-binding MarR family transcriptional regulator
MRDFVRERGYLTLGSRLKRLGERLQAEVQELARAEGIDLPAGLFPTVGALAEAGSLTIGELAQALGISQPGATRNVDKLVRLGLVESVPGGTDRRVRAVALSDQGRRLVVATEHDLWPRIGQAVAEICSGLDGPLLDILSGIEWALDRRPLHVRAAKYRSNGNG